MGKDLNNGVLLAIRGGGVKSAVGIGVLKALEEVGIPVKEVSGASLGSIVAALVANGFNSKEILQLFLQYNKILTRAAILLGGDGSIVIEDSVNKEIGYKTFDELEKKCYINASYNNELKPRMFLFSNDETPYISVGVGCRASSSLQPIYGYYRATIDGKKYRFFDGGFTANPYIPETNLTTVYCSFENGKSIMPNISWKKTPLIAEENSDITIKPNLGKIGTVGSCEDMETAYNLAYKESIKTLKKIKS